MNMNREQLSLIEYFIGQRVFSAKSSLSEDDIEDAEKQRFDLIACLQIELGDVAKSYIDLTEKSSWANGPQFDLYVASQHKLYLGDLKRFEDAN